MGENLSGISFARVFPAKADKFSGRGRCVKGSGWRRRCMNSIYVILLQIMFADPKVPVCQ